MDDLGLQGKIQEVCQDIQEFFVAGGQRFEDEDTETSALGQQIIARLDELNSRGTCQVYNCMWGSDEDHNSTIYQLRWLARAASKHNQFTECLIFFGPGGGGKDAKVGIFKSLLGDGPTNLMAFLPKTYFHTLTGNNPEGATPMTMGLRGADMIVVMEAPASPVDASRLKQFVEPNTRTAARQMYARKGDALSLQVAGATVFAQNHRMTAKDKDDDAFEERLAHVYCPMIFKANPTPNTNERLCIPEYKTDCSTEPWACEVFHWIRGIFHTLAQCGGRYITPRPICEDERDMTKKTIIIDFLLERCNWVGDIAMATNASDITNILSPLVLGQYKVSLANIGVEYVKKPRNCPGRPYALKWGKHPNHNGVARYAVLKDGNILNQLNARAL
jgi:hypothetical protein